MTAVAGRSAARLLGGTTAAVGGALMVWPHELAVRFSKGTRTPGNGIVRVLGARQLVQGATQVARPNPEVLIAGIIVDLLHASSMLALSVFWTAYRRPALSSAAVATASALAGAAVLITQDK